ncbi:MAG: SPOR domain-containing protein [Candidatus Omnitrophica bacterium]|nr:SPOR domain-containing protein [Candidatus Omnitrophota bacterium]
MERRIINLALFSIWFIFCVWQGGYCLDIDKPKIYFLNGEYKLAIAEGEKLLAQEVHGAGSDQLYYILGMSYLKDGNYLRASDIFEIILKEFKDSALEPEARLGLGDTYFLRGDYDKARAYYTELLNTHIRLQLTPLVYYRLSQCAFKQGNVEEGNGYLSKLKKDFPSSLETSLNKELDNSSGFYTVQIGSFTNPANANNLCNRLINKGYDAYSEEAGTDGKKVYRVRVGRLKSRSEAVEIRNKLSLEGYPTNIIP